MTSSTVTLLGIRHHGPGSARSLVRALDELQPDVVLLEAPLEAEALFAWIGDEHLVPPVAQLAYVTDQPERSAFYPFAAFSPEWSALDWARRHNVVVRCIDLPAANSFAMAHDRMAGVDAIGHLAAAAGYDDAEAWWEDVVEHRGHASSLNAFAAIGEAMTAVRGEIAPPELSAVEAAREATMRQGIRQAVASGAQRIAVVCGAWHVPALAAVAAPGGESTSGGGTVSGGGAAGRAADAALLRGLPKVKVTMTWVPWTHQRLAAQSGYGAGVASPGWYAHVFAHPGASGITAWFVRQAALLRDRDIAVSPDHLIAAARLADALGALRGRPQAGLSEVTDAARAVLAEGRTGPLALIHEAMIVGDQIGTVPESVPVVPLIRDLAAEQKRTRLKPEALERTLELDLRTSSALTRSHLLHRLWLLDVPWGRPAESRASTGTFRETWTLRWEPELAVRLIEASGLGTTLVAAATAKVLDRAEQMTTLADLTELVEAALFADLPDAVAGAIASLSAKAVHDSDVSHLMSALTPLARAARYGDVRGTEASSLRATIDGLALRICAGLATAYATFDDDAAPVAAERLSETQAALALIDHPTAVDLWPRALALVAEHPAGHGLVRGRATRLLADAEIWPRDKVASTLSRLLTRGTPPRTGAAFVDGFLAGSGTVLIHDAGLLAMLDTWLATMATDVFADVVPLLRRAVGAFAVGERRQIGQLVSGRGDGRPAAPYGWDLDEQRAAAGFATVRMLLGLGELAHSFSSSEVVL